MRICLSMSLTNIVVESDSLLIVNLINKRMKAHWQIKSIIEQIWGTAKSVTFHFMHIYREGNAVADYLANHGVTTMKCNIFNEVVSLPRQVKTSLKLDQDRVPNFRFRPKKKSFVVHDGGT